VRSRFGADVSASAAVVGIRIHRDAQPATIGRPLDAPVDARSIFTRPILVRSWVGTAEAATAAVVEVIGQIGACPVAIDGARDAGVLTLAGNASGRLVLARLAGVPTASAVVDVMGEIRAGVAAPAGATKPGGVAVAIPAGRQTGILLRLVATPAEVFARVPPTGPGGSHS
jgi:hypothetical protein